MAASIAGPSCALEWELVSVLLPWVLLPSAPPTDGHTHADTIPTLRAISRGARCAGARSMSQAAGLPLAARARILKIVVSAALSFAGASANARDRGMPTIFTRIRPAIELPGALSNMGGNHVW